MAIRFAHLADVHLGAFRDATLREINLEAFKHALSQSVAANLDFVVIAGDLFHVALPDMRVVDEATKAMRACRDAGLRIYLVYGSHDYSPTATSVIDVLASAGVLRKIHSTDAAHPEIVRDEPTGAVLAGALARSRGLEAEFFERADWREFERAAGPRVFVFHSAVEEHKPGFLSRSEGIPLARFPKGCAYYAGGHVHERAEIDETGKGYGRIVFPGPLFAADYRDLEAASRDAPGYYEVEIVDSSVKTVFKQSPVPNVAVVAFDASGKSASSVGAELLERLRRVDVSGKIVLLNAAGELGEGKPGEIDFASVRDAAIDAGAKTFYLNRAQLSAREADARRVEGANRQEIEAFAFASAASECKTGNAFLKENGARVAAELLLALSAPRDEEAKEKKSDYEAKLSREAGRILGIQ